MRNRNVYSSLKKLTFIIALMIMCGIRNQPKNDRHGISWFALGLEEEEDDFLAEILAEEQAQAEELAQMEAEMRELEAMKAQRRQQEKDRQQQQSSKMKPGGAGAGGGFSQQKKSSMPGGVPNAQFNKIEEELRKKESESQEAKRKSQENSQDEANRRKAEQIAREREAKYEAELARVTDEKAKRMMKRQKVKDARIVKTVLNKSEKGRHYAVLGLGLQSWGEIEIGPFTLFSVSPGDVKRSYRKTARSVHPDKNRDGRATEAFDALERSAAILMDGTKKKEYDAKLKRQRKELIKWGYSALWKTWSSTMTSLSVLHKVLGPFATPITLLTLLII